MRTLSSGVKAALFSPDGLSEIYITLVEISHTQIASTIRLSDDTIDTISNGSTYKTYWLELDDADQLLSGVPTGSLRIDNIDLTILAALSYVTTSRATVTIKRVLASAPNTLIIPSVAYSLTGYRSTDDTLTLNLSLAIPGDEPFPGYSFNPSHFPGLFGI